MIKYGLISETDGRTIEKTLDLILAEFDLKPKPNEDFASFLNPMKITEIGLFDCGTANGILSYLSRKCAFCYTGIDNEKDKPIDAPPWLNYIKGDSKEVYNQLEDNSQHMIFVDGDHSFIGVISDFFAYADKVKKGGYFCFHDTGAHIEKFKDFQHGDKDNPDAYISVRKALCRMGLGVSYKNESAMVHFGFKPDYWELIFDEADETNDAGGVTVFKKLY